jgi:hypothetical protein
MASAPLGWGGAGGGGGACPQHCFTGGLLLPPVMHWLKFLEAELKASYATKNFTIKNALLELEKRHRAAIDADGAMQALWADVAELLVSTSASLWAGGGRGGPCPLRMLRTGGQRSQCLPVSGEWDRAPSAG